MSPEKRVNRAIDIAQESGVPLEIAAKIYPEDQRYFNEVLEPLITAPGPLVEYLGEIGQLEKNAPLGKAAALLFPIEWPEPFGLVISTR